MAKAKGKKITLEEALVPVDEQPYQVPENWCWTEIGKITSVQSGGTPSTSHDEYYEGGDIPWISPADLSGYNNIYIRNGNKYITQLGLEKSSARLLPKDTVCLSTRAPIGYVVIAENELCTNQGFKSFLPSKAYIPKYLYWYLKANKDMLESMASGTTFLELSGTKAGQVVFPLPPLTEQQRIVEQIENLFSKLDEAKEKAQAVVDSFETRKAAILHKAFTGELTTQWRKEHSIGLDSWKRVTINEIFEVFSGKGFKKKEYSPDGVKLIRISNVTYNSLVWEDTKYLPISYLLQEPELVLQSGDIVMALNRPITNGKLKVSMVDNAEQYILYQRVGCLRRKNLYNSAQYLLYALLSRNFLHQVEKNLQGSDQPYINLPPLKTLSITICLPQEQIEVVQILDNFLSKEQQAKETAETVINQIDIMEKSILARAFRGKLGTNNPEEESSIVLLKRIFE